MARNWWSARLLRPSGGDDCDRDADVLLELLPDTVGALRAANGDAQWSFQRLAGGFGLSCHGTPEALAEAGRQLGAGARRLGWLVRDDAGNRAVPPHPELSTIASDLALALARRGEPTADDALPTAVHHLRVVAGLVPAGERRPFLFECWRFWSARLAPGVRVKLTITAEAERLPPVARVDDPWLAYHRAMAALGEVTGSMKYPLFRLADSTLNRLGIPLADQALAALVVRRIP